MDIRCPRLGSWAEEAAGWTKPLPQDWQSLCPMAGKALSWKEPFSGWKMPQAEKEKTLQAQVVDIIDLIHQSSNNPHDHLHYIQLATNS